MRARTSSIALLDEHLAGIAATIAASATRGTS